MARHAASLMVILSIVISSSVSAADCLETLSQKLKPGDSLTVWCSLKQPVSGILQSFDATMESMTITQQLESQIKSISFSSNEISEIGFRKPGKFRPSYTLWGAAIGMTPGLVHFVLAGRSDDCDRVDCGDGYDQGKYLGGVMLTAVGGVIGLVIGTILGTELSSDQKVSCEF